MWTDSDRNMSHFFMMAYSNFAKYGYVFDNADLFICIKMENAIIIKNFILEIQRLRKSWDCTLISHVMDNCDILISIRHSIALFK